MNPCCITCLIEDARMQKPEVNTKQILQMPPKCFNISYNRRDLILYALGIGETDRQFTHECDPFFAAFPLCMSNWIAS
uniref:AlNc14C88G5579 protein n=1 Tax=Albugo laibachii Nc14 TaxID=890382 RepID=F0WG49_9STRA|nr:AlNc14C88G5579 [Albugo laibachii Nc14]|eukprot:CCA20184.1 AlNc14C88G5579 [Albugo laibachii Nc14]